MQYHKALKDTQEMLLEIREAVPAVTRVTVVNGELVFDAQQPLSEDELQFLARYLRGKVVEYLPPKPEPEPPKVVPQEPPPENTDG